MTAKISRGIAFMLCIVLLLGMMPMGISAAEDGQSLQSINFMDPASAEKFTVANQSTTKINEGEGLYLVSTTGAFEPCNGQISSFSPVDVVSVPVSGDWTATIKLKFSQGSSQGYYEFFGFYAKAGDDYDNMAGIRAGDGAIQDFLRKDGTVTADTDGVKTSSGLKSATNHWFRIAKSGDSYTCYWSTDGENFKETFSYEDTGIDAEELILDAYSGMATGYNYTVEYMYFGDDTEGMNKWYLDTIIGSVLDKIPEVIPINVKDTYSLPRGSAGCTVTYKAEPDCIEGNKIVAMDKETAVKLTVSIATGGTSIEKVLNVTVPAKGTGTAPVDTFTVTFNPNVSGMASVEVKVDENDYVTIPESMTRVGYAVTWRNGNATFNFDTPITQNYTLTASWTKDWNQMYSLAEEYADFFPFGNFGTQSPNGDQVTREYNTYSGNSGKMTYNFGANESRNAYNQAVSEINADSSLTQEEKDAKILEADGKVMLGGSNPLQGDLNRIQSWNEQHPNEPKKYYRQHVIAWHGSEQNAAFYHEGFDTSKPLASKEVMNARLDSYIEAMFKRYQPWDDIILSWDIVNEALDDYNGMVRNGWNGSGWGETTLDDASNQSSAWGTIYRMKDNEGNPVKDLTEERLMAESEWIRVAFASARKWQQELGVHWKLYYNDYMNSSMLYEPKMTNTLKMLKPIYEAGNIDGYGMQARLSYAYPGIDLLRYQIEEGLKVADEVSFSEGDVRTDFEVNPLYDPEKPTRRVVQGDEEWDEGGSGSYSRRSQSNGNTYDVSNGPVRRKANFNANDPETMRAQADYYADLLDIMLEKADLGKVGAIAIDGTSDGNTFNRGTGCQIWDSNNNEKPAFFAVIGAPNRFKMGKAIEAGPDASEKEKYTADSWAVYAAALEAAEDLVDVRIYDDKGVEAVKKATADLIAATEALEEAGEVIVEPKECPSKDFTDAPAKGDWAHEGIDYCVANDLMNGVGDNKFNPKGNVTRAQLVTILYRVAKSPAVEFKGTFTDVEAGKWYSNAIEWAAANNIVNGVGEGKFNPMGQITREQIAAILYRYSNNPVVEGDLSAFPDNATTSTYAVNALVWATKEGLINGIKSGDVTNLAPKANATRAQIASIIMRFLGGSFECE